MKEIKTLSDLVHFEAYMRAFGLKIPQNMFIVSPEIIEESLEFIGKDKHVFKHGTGVQIYGINVVRDFAEIVDVTE